VIKAEFSVSLLFTLQSHDHLDMLIMHIFTVTFDIFNESLLNTSYFNNYFK